jgi:hypothetical protein
MQAIALKSQAACHSFLTVRRVPRLAALRSTALLFTRMPLSKLASNGIPSLRGTELVVVLMWLSAMSMPVTGYPNSSGKLHD